MIIPGEAAVRRVFLVGAGPGDPDLLTVKALRVLQQADVILHDSLVSAEILSLAKPRARLIDVGKRCGRHSASQETISALLVQEAEEGGVVLRLKGGDPMIFGRATEEMQALTAHGITYEVIPGITAATAAACALKISLTQRYVSRAIHFIAGHSAEGRIPAHDFAALAQQGGTLAIYMGAVNFDSFAARLIEAGLQLATPAIALENVSTPYEKILFGDLATLPKRLKIETGSGPVLILIGEALAAAVKEEKARKQVAAF